MVSKHEKSAQPNQDPKLATESIRDLFKALLARASGDPRPLAELDAEKAAREAEVKVKDLEHELAGEEALAQDLGTHSYEVTPGDPALDDAVRQSVKRVHEIDVDRRNLPPQ